MWSADIQKESLLMDPLMRTFEIRVFCVFSLREPFDFVSREEYSAKHEEHEDMKITSSSNK